MDVMTMTNFVCMYREKRRDRKVQVKRWRKNPDQEYTTNRESLALPNQLKLLININIGTRQRVQTMEESSAQGPQPIKC